MKRSMLAIRFFSFLGPAVSLMSQLVLASSGVQFTARVDQDQISIEDTVALKLTVSVDSNANASEPQFAAPDFQVVNEFNSVSVQYDSARGMQKNQEITVVLRPRSKGNFKISGIQIKVDDQVLTANDINIGVTANGPRGKQSVQSGGRTGGGFGGGSGRIRLMPPGGGAPRRGDDPDSAKVSAFIRAEIDRSAVFKGEQIVVSYYLYHQMKVFNLQVEKFPVLSGFLREDLEMPIMGQRLESEAVTIKNEPYQRSLLARYAAYPLQEGKLDIDSMTLRYNYYSSPRNSLVDDEDPFFSFFQQLSPRAAGAESEHLNVQVLPLPEMGRPSSFVGGVGDFTVNSAVNKYEVKANEAVSFVLKVEGRGNVASIQEPKTVWPNGIEMYESKGKSQIDRGGVGRKLFEFLLIPRATGKIQLPAVEVGFFDPIKKQYYTKSTAPIDLTVTESAAGNGMTTTTAPVNGATSSVASSISATPSPSSSPKSAISTPPAVSNPDEPRGLKPLYVHPAVEGGQSPIWRLLYLACSAGLALLIALVGQGLFSEKASRSRP